MERLVKKDKEICYEVIRTNKKKEFYFIEIKEDVVYIRVPESADNKTIKSVLSQRFLVLYYKVHPLERYVLHYWGKLYKVRCVKSNTDKVVVNEDEIVIKATKVTQRYFASVYYKFLAKLVESELEKLLVQAREDFSEITIPKISVKAIKGFLGYNYITHIHISPRIAKYDIKFLKVLLYHEICHSIIRGHSGNFWKLLEEKLPGGVDLNIEMNTTKFNDYL